VVARRYDVMVVGSGPAGSVAATVLARGGARVALVDKARFPRDKACGDLVGPRGIQVLADLGIDITPAHPLDDMDVIGPSGRRVRLPCFPGTTYPGRVLAIPRTTFDAALHDAAVAAGAEPVVARADEPEFDDGRLAGFTLSTGETVTADAVIGADGATSRVAEVAGLVDPKRVLWGFAIRGYVEAQVARPRIYFWDSQPRRAFPGYGWLFPGLDGAANVGLGVGLMDDRGKASVATREFPAFQRYAGAGPARTRLGGWLKMGMAGTTPARERVLLVGDAAGLVNPLQGEGISQAMRSGRAAAEAVLGHPANPAERYQAFLAESYGRFSAVAATLHHALLPRPRAVSTVGRLLTAPGLSHMIAGGWSIYWNDLLDGAKPSGARTLAAAADRAGRAVAAALRSGAR
jgi:geranylgeranyl reductase family protein